MQMRERTMDMMWFLKRGILEQSDLSICIALVLYLEGISGCAPDR